MIDDVVAQLSEAIYIGLTRSKIASFNRIASYNVCYTKLLREDIRLGELIAKIEPGKIKEVVLATSTTVEGEATASYIVV